MTLRSATAHASTAKHRRVVERYIADLNTANIAAMDVSPGVTMLDDFVPGDPFLDSINQSALIHPPTPPTLSPQTHKSPSQSVSPPRAMEADSLAPDAHLVPSIHRTAIREAINRALDAFLLPDGSDEDEALEDVEDVFNPPRNVEVPTGEHCSPFFDCFCSPAMQKNSRCLQPAVVVHLDGLQWALGALGPTALLASQSLSQYAANVDNNRAHLTLYHIYQDRFTHKMIWKSCFGYCGPTESKLLLLFQI